MRVDLLMVTFAKDFPFAEYSLKSAHRFCSGFGALVIVVPHPDVAMFAAVAEPLGFIVKGFDEREGKGFVHHEAIITEADHWCPGADVIVHIDSDCIFMDQCTPNDYVIDGRPVIYREKFDDLKERHPGRYNWKHVVKNAVGIDPEWDGMCRHPNAYLAGTYGQVRALIERYTQRNWKEYILSCENSFPQGYAEHPTISAVAMLHANDKYHWVDFKSDRDYEYEKGRDKLIALWSHSTIDGTCSRHPGRTAREVIEEVLG